MADNTIDTLSLEIESSSSQANKALDNLAKKLLNVNKALQSVNSGGLRNYARDMGRVSASIKALNGIKVNVPNLGGLSKQLESLGKVNFSALEGSAQPLKELSEGLRSLAGLQNVSIPKLETKNIKSISSAIENLSKIETDKIPQISNGIKAIADSIVSLNSVNPKETGINNTIGAIKRLMEVNIESFDSSAFGKIASSIGSLASIPDVSSGLNRFMASLQKLANAGASIGIVAKELPLLGEALEKTVNKMAGAKNVSESVNMFTQSIGRLASAGAKTGQTAQGLGKLATETLDFFNTMSNAPKISQNTIAMTQALAQLASAGGRVGTATGTVTSAFNKLSQISSKTASVVKNAVSGIVSAFSKITNSSGGLKTASFNLGTLLKTAIGFRAIQGLGNFGKNAITLGSNITEVENVVDTAFGSMANKAYEFASTATKQFGLSELAAKNYSGTMMAMLNSSGVAQDAAAEMSTTLAGLAGDLASFYNLDTDTAFQKIRSGISGETEPLKQLGINMSVANLQAYALANGITKSYQAMSQAEQATLRYNYLMSVTTQQQGDFARTAGTFANQWRLLKLNIESVSAVIGQGLIAAVLPGIKALNALMGALMRAAEAFRNFVYTLTGYKLGGATKGISDYTSEMSDLGSASDTASGGIDNATNSTKKLKKALSVLPFDQLNQLTSNQDTGSASSGSGTGGSGGLSGADLGDASSFLDALGKSDVKTPINKWAQRIRNAFLAEDWDGLGFEIADGLNRGLQKIYDVINWNNVGPKITYFVNAFTKSFNSLVDYLDFDLAGRVIGTGINTLVNTFNLLAGPGGIDFQNIGTKLSVGLRGMVDEIEWVNLGNALGNGFMISWNLLNGFVSDMSRKGDAGLTGWAELGIALGNAVNGIFDNINFTTIGETLALGFNGIFESLKNLALTIKWNDIATNIYNGINTMIHNVDWAKAGQSLSKFVTDLLGTFKKVAEKTDWQSLGKGIGDFLSNIEWGTIFSQVFSIITDALGGLIAGFAETTAGKIGIALVGAMGGIKLAGAALPLADSLVKELTGTNIIGKISSGVSGMFKGALSLFKSGGAIYEAFGGAAINLSIAFESLTGIAVPVGASMAVIVAGIVAVVAAVVDLWNTSERFRTAVTNAFDKVKSSLVNAFQKIKEAITPLWDSIKNLGSALYDFYESSGIKKIVELFASLAVTLGGTVLSTAIDAISTAFSGLAKVLTGAIDVISGVLKILSGLFTLDFDKVVSGFKNIGSGILEAFSGLGDLLFGVGGDIISGLLNGILDAIKGIGSWIEENIFKPFIDGFKSAFGIHSPSTVMAEQGGYVISGLLQGLKDAIGSVLNWVAGIPGWFVEKLGDAKSWLVNKGKDAISGLKSGWESVKNSEFLSIVKKIGAETFSSIGDIKNKVLQKGKDIISGLKTGYNSVKESGFLSTVKQLKNNVFASIGDLKSKVKSKGSDIIKGLKDGLNGNWGTLSSWLGKLPSKISNAIPNLFNTGKNAIQNFINGFGSLHIPLPHISVSWNSHTVGPLSFSTPSFDLNWYKMGGLFESASMIGVGEAGKEAVLPLENKRTMSMIADSILSNASGMGMDEETLTNAVARGVAMAMMNNMQGQSTPEYIQNNIYYDGDVMARVITKAMKERDYRFNPTPQY